MVIVVSAHQQMAAWRTIMSDNATGGNSGRTEWRWLRFDTSSDGTFHAFLYRSTGTGVGVNARGEAAGHGLRRPTEPPREIASTESAGRSRRRSLEKLKSHTSRHHLSFVCQFGIIVS